MKKEGLAGMHFRYKDENLNVVKDNVQEMNNMDFHNGVLLSGPLNVLYRPLSE